MLLLYVTLYEKSVLGKGDKTRDSVITWPGHLSDIFVVSGH